VDDGLDLASRHLQSTVQRRLTQTCDTRSATA